MNRSGLTVIESMIAMVILGLVMVSISQFYQYTVYRNEREEQKSVANAMVRDYLEVVKKQYLIPSDEQILPAYRIANGDTLYYHINEDVALTSDTLKEGTLIIHLEGDTLIRVQTLIAKGVSFE